MKFADDHKKSFLITSGCYLILGLVLLFFPQIDEMKICYALGGITVLMGLIYIIIYFARPTFTDVYRLDFVYGAVFMAGGVYAIAQPFVVAQWLYIIVGLAICVDSLIKLQNAIDLKRLNSSIWWAVLMMSLVTGTMGVMLLFAKTYAFVTPTQFIGISLIVDGIINIISFTTLAVNLKRLRKAKAEPEIMPEKEPQPTPAQQPEAAPAPAQESAEEDSKYKGFFDMMGGAGADEKQAENTEDEEGEQQ